MASPARSSAGVNALELTSVRDSLLLELQHLQGHLQLHDKSIQLEPVLVSREDLKEVPRHELLARLSASSRSSRK